jgi:hypothetical protein
MNEKDPLLNKIEETTEKTTPEILTNEYDPAVVIDEKTRTVLLTENETVIIEKDPVIDTVPKNRPRKVYGGMWGPTEIGVVGVSAFALLALLLVYLFVVVPSNREVEKNKAERDQLEKQLTETKAKYGDITNTQAHVAKLISSVDDFEIRFLPIASVGQTALYQRINGLIAANGLVNTTGPNYLPLDIIDPTRPESDEEKGKSKFKSLFPGVYISMTVEGSYQGLRRFIREIETTEQFVVVSTVELEPTDSQKKEKQPGAPDGSSVSISGPNGPKFPNPNGSQMAPAQPKGKTHGETVALRLEMAAYFRRPNYVPQPAPDTSAQ